MKASCQSIYIAIKIIQVAITVFSGDTAWSPFTPLTGNPLYSIRLENQSCPVVYQSRAVHYQTEREIPSPGLQLGTLDLKSIDLDFLQHAPDSSKWPNIRPS